jgi:hypothetical protein
MITLMGQEPTIQCAIRRATTQDAFWRMVCSQDPAGVHARGVEVRSSCEHAGLVTTMCYNPSSTLHTIAKQVVYMCPCSGEQRFHPHVGIKRSQECDTLKGSEEVAWNAYPGVNRKVDGRVRKLVGCFW